MCIGLDELQIGLHTRVQQSVPTDAQHRRVDVGQHHTAVVADQLAELLARSPVPPAMSSTELPLRTPAELYRKAFPQAVDAG